MCLHPQDNPLISVVMPVYNAGGYVADAIRSILGQGYGNFEMIVVDDGSTDDSANVVQRFADADRRIRPLFLPHHGVSHALNAGVALAQGEWVAYLDADDMSMPDRFSVQLDWLRRTGSDVAGGCAADFGDHVRSQHSLKWFPESHEAVAHDLVFRCAMLPSTVMLRAAIARDHPFDEQVAFQDYDMWTRLAPRYRLGNVQQILARYRRHPQQSSVVKATRFREEMRRIRARYLAEIFPETLLAERDIVCRVADDQPMSSLAELERAGEWFVRLAHVPDRYLRRRMVERWKKTCWRAARLGLGAFLVYRRILPRLELAG